MGDVEPAIPEPDDDDFLENVERSVLVARKFKILVKQLCVVDWSSEIEGLDRLAEAEVDSNKRLRGDFPLLHGDYKVAPPKSKKPEVDRVTVVESNIGLSTASGGRNYKIGVDTGLGMIMQVDYYEDRPLETARHHNLDVLARFSISTEMAPIMGINFNELTRIESLVDNIEAVQAAGRLTPAECPGW